MNLSGPHEDQCERMRRDTERTDSERTRSLIFEWMVWIGCQVGAHSAPSWVEYIGSGVLSRFDTNIVLSHFSGEQKFIKTQENLF